MASPFGDGSRDGKLVPANRDAADQRGTSEGRTPDRSADIPAL